MRGVLIGVIIFSFGLLVGIPFLISSNNLTSEESASLTNVTDLDWTYGNKEAKVVLIEYGDFQCEACAKAYTMIEKIKEEYGDNILIVARYFPLPGHQYSKQSASVVEASGQQGKYWEMSNIMYERQDAWSASNDTTEIFESYAREINLDMEKFAMDIKSQTTKDRIEKDLDSGKKLGIEATPSFFINGKKINTPTNIIDFRKILDKELTTYDIQ